MCYLEGHRKSKIVGVVANSADALAADGVSVARARTRSRTLVGRFLRRSVSFTSYEPLDSYLSGVDAVVSIETPSFISRDVIRLAQRVGAKAFIVVWQAIPGHPYYLLPPFSTNARKVEESASAFIAATHRAAEHLRRRSIDGKRIEVIYPGVGMRSPIHASDRPLDGRISLLYIGNLVKHKGFDLILRAY